MKEPFIMVLLYPSQQSIPHRGYTLPASAGSQILQRHAPRLIPQLVEQAFRQAAVPGGRSLVLIFIMCGSRKEVVRVDSIIGDYLFDGMSLNAIVYTSVYEDEGKLYAMFEMERGGALLRRSGRVRRPPGRNQRGLSSMPWRNR